MATAPTNRITALPAVVFTAPADKLTDDQITELKAKYGLDLRIKSHTTAIDDALRRMSDVSGYDRTNPGYDRSYDKSGADMLSHGVEVINPIANKPR